MVALDSGVEAFPRRGISSEHVIGATGLVFYLICYHMQFQLPGINVPFLGCGICSVFLFLFYVRTAPRNLATDCFLLMAIGLVSAMVVVEVGLGERASALIYMVYSTFCGAVLFLTIRKLPRDLAARIFLTLAIILIVGSEIEVNSELVRHTSNSVSVYMHSDIDYDSWARDLSYTGSVRPKFFASEPSVVARNVSLLTLLWCALSNDKFKAPLALSLLALAGYVGGSPSVIAGMAAIGVLQVNELLVRRNFKFSFALIFQFVLTAIGGLIALGIVAYLNQDRIQALLVNQDVSTIMRTVLPPMVARSVLLSHPLFGVGLGGRALYEVAFADAFAQLGISYQYLLDTMGELSNNLPNTVFILLSTYGLVGTTAYLWVLSRMQRRYMPQFSLLYFFGLLSFSPTLGAIQGVPVATFVFSLLAIRPLIKHRDNLPSPADTASDAGDSSGHIEAAPGS